MKIIRILAVSIITIIFAGCASSAVQEPINEPPVSLPPPEKIVKKVDIDPFAYFGIKPVAIGDIKYGLKVSKIEPGTIIRLDGPKKTSGTLEWDLSYGHPTLYFKTKFSPEDTIQLAEYDREIGEYSDKYDVSIQTFEVPDTSSIPLAVRMGSEAEVLIESMKIAVTETSEPSTVTISSVELVGDPYETINEEDPIWIEHVRLTTP